MILAWNCLRPNHPAGTAAAHCLLQSCMISGLHRLPTTEYNTLSNQSATNQCTQQSAHNVTITLVVKEMSKNVMEVSLQNGVIGK